MDSDHAADRLTPREDHSHHETDEPVLLAGVDGITMVRGGCMAVGQMPVLNRLHDLYGLHASIDMAFGCRHSAHAHGQGVSGSAVGGQELRSMAAADEARSSDGREPG
jgi:hypothetical protein